MRLQAWHGGVEGGAHSQRHGTGTQRLCGGRRVELRATNLRPSMGGARGEPEQSKAQSKQSWEWNSLHARYAAAMQALLCIELSAS